MPPLTGLLPSLGASLELRPREWLRGCFPTGPVHLGPWLVLAVPSV